MNDDLKHLIETHKPCKIGVAWSQTIASANEGYKTCKDPGFMLYGLRYSGWEEKMPVIKLQLLYLCVSCIQSILGVLGGIGLRLWCDLKLYSIGKLSEEEFQFLREVCRQSYETEKYFKNNPQRIWGTKAILRAYCWNDKADPTLIAASVARYCQKASGDVVKEKEIQADLFRQLIPNLWERSNK